MDNLTSHKIKTMKLSFRNKLLMYFFVVLAIGGISINIIFQSIIQNTFSNENIDPVIIGHVSRHFAIIGSGVTIAGMFIILLLAFFMSRNITNPLKKLTDGMIELAQGKWDTRIKMKSPDEIGQLAEGFNLMGEQIEKALSDLKTAKDYTDNIVASVPSILIALSDKLNTLSTNTAFNKLTEQFPALTVQHFIHPVEGEIKKNLETGETSKRNFVIIPEGSDINLFFSAVISRIGNGKSENTDRERARVLLTITDITERTKMKEMVLQSKQDWEDTFNAIPDMITIHDKDFNIIQANAAAQEMLHLPFLSPGIVNKCYRYYHGTESAPQGCPSCECMVSKKYATFEVFEPHLEKYIEIRSIPRLNTNNEIMGLIHIVRDITQRKQIEEEHNQLLKIITSAKIEWEVTFDTVNEFIILIDKGSNIKRCNSSFAQHIGLPAGKLVNKKYFDYFLFCNENEYHHCQEHIRKEESLERIEVRTQDNHWFYLSQRPLRDKKGNYMHTVIIATDITDIKNTQQKLKQSEQDLKKQVEDLEKFYEMAIGRELKMKDLKKEIKKLNEKISTYEVDEFANN